MAMNDLLILGGQGQVGQALRVLADRNGLRHRALGHGECDIADPTAVAEAVGQACFVVNCAAYTAVDKAETDEAAAFRVNALGARTVAQACAAARVPLLHVSTDYIFGGSKTDPWSEGDVPDPPYIYGRS